MPLNVDKLNELLVEKNLNYSELAKKANISKNQISRIVNKDKPREIGRASCRERV